jgi:hypothetical protein
MRRVPVKDEKDGDCCREGIREVLDFPEGKRSDRRRNRGRALRVSVCWQEGSIRVLELGKSDHHSESLRALKYLSRMKSEFDLSAVSLLPQLNSPALHLMQKH